MVEAANEYRKVVLADSNHLQATYKLANLCSMRREFDEAIINYRECLKIEPTFYEAQQRLLIQYVYMYEDYSGRKDMLQRVVQRLENRTCHDDKTSLDLYSAALSYLLMESGYTLEERLDKANTHLDELIQSFPKIPIISGRKNLRFYIMKKINYLRKTSRKLLNSVIKRHN